MEMQDIGAGFMLGVLAVATAAANWRDSRLANAAEDAQIAASITGAAAASWSASAISLRRRLIYALGDIDRLEEKVDDLTAERSELIAVIGDMLSEIKLLKATKGPSLAVGSPYPFTVIHGGQAA